MESLASSNVPNRPGRPTGPWRAVVQGVPGRVDKDGRARRPSFIKMAVLGVDARALQSSDMIEQMAYSGRHLQGPAVTFTGRNPAHSIS
ncbi:hypothetical protein L873DRAFT_1816206 [Choiromyces venosus 120613-1]|uniref:Uncharacterized protein n=1 Tax=Choiromyces venosus 120613-1 TaxID=1336337 RepID=A0A3N4J526_9PEZI|nr:hypothetical protein L873DRAFT_1816206 [Choiromyces venosus 120613-1]